MSEADGAARIGRPADSDDVGWIRDYRAWRRGRLKAVQDSAGVWLGLLTTLLTLLGSVVLFKGGDLVTSVTHNGWFQFFLILLVSLVFVSAILALIAGGSATWGGLGDIPEEEAAEAKTTAAASLPAPSLAEDNETAGGKTGGLRDLWFRFWLLFSGESKKEREKLREMKPRSQLLNSGEERWKSYKQISTNSGNRKRAYLHASRGLGVATALLIGMQVVLVVIAGTVAPVPTEVIVIHGGRATCVSTADTKKLAHVSQVIPVSSC